MLIILNLESIISKFSLNRYKVEWHRPKQHGVLLQVVGFVLSEENVFWNEVSLSHVKTDRWLLICFLTYDRTLLWRDPVLYNQTGPCLLVPSTCNTMPGRNIILT